MSEKVSVADDIAPDVCAIVVNYGTPALTTTAVESILRSTGVALEVILVDNASPDDSANRLRRRFHDNPAVTLFVRDRNDGYTGANNAGLALSRARRARYAFVLNSDTTLDPDCLRLLVAAADAAADIALVTPRIFSGEPAGDERLWFGGARYSLWHGRPVHVAWGKPARFGWTSPRDLDFASGCALLVKLALVPAAGEELFDASLFAYAEDLDLSLRVRRAGYRIRYVPDATVRHFEGSSHVKAGGQSLRFYLNTRNLLRVDARHARWYHWVSLLPMLLVDVIGRYCAVAVRRRDWSIFTAVLRGVLHAITGGRHPIEPSVEPTSPRPNEVPLRPRHPS